MANGWDCADRRLRSIPAIGTKFGNASAIGGSFSKVSMALGPGPPEGMTGTFPCFRARSLRRRNCLRTREILGGYDDQERQAAFSGAHLFWGCFLPRLPARAFLAVRLGLASRKPRSKRLFPDDRRRLCDARSLHDHRFEKSRSQYIAHLVRGLVKHRPRGDHGVGSVSKSNDEGAPDR